MKIPLSRAPRRAIMTPMKRFLLIAALLALCAPFFLPFGKEAEAEELTYAVADGKEIWFYAEADENTGLFIIPYTYYVIVLDYGAPFCAVQYFDDVSPYKAVKGYCKTEELTFVDFVPARPFLRVELTYTYQLSVSSSVTMGSGTFNTVEKTFVYYGTSYLGTARFHYVSSGGIFDYIPAAQEITYELNTDYLTETVVAPAVEEEETAETSSPTPLQIALICLAGVAACAIVFFVLRGKKPPVREAEF